MNSPTVEYFQRILLSKSLFCNKWKACDRRPKATAMHRENWNCYSKTEEIQGYPLYPGRTRFVRSNLWIILGSRACLQPCSSANVAVPLPAVVSWLASSWAPHSRSLPSLSQQEGWENRKSKSKKTHGSREREISKWRKQEKNDWYKGHHSLPPTRRLVPNQPPSNSHPGRQLPTFFVCYVTFIAEDNVI